MTDRDALYAAICADPEEDTPRLAFADLLQEEGGKENAFRAEYIRGAIRVAREELWSPAWKAANKKWDKYRTKVRSRAEDRTLAWVAHLRGRAVAFEFDRGFVGHITVHSKRFVAEGEKFFAQDPIRSVKFVSLDSKSWSVPLKQLLACPHLARVAKLGLETTTIHDKDLALLSGSKHLAGLRSITLAGNQGYTAKGLAKFLQDMPAIDELQVTVFGMYDAKFAEALAAAPAIAKLTSLNLSEHYANAKGVAAIFASQHLAKLRELRLSLGYDYDEEHDVQMMDRRKFTTKDGAVVAAALAGCKFPNLRFLDLTGCKIGDTGLEAIAAKGRFPVLRQLTLDENNITRDGLKVLADSAAGKQLVYLRVGFNPKLENEKVMKGVCAMFPNANVSGYGIW